MPFVINQSRVPFSTTGQPRQDQRTYGKGDLI